MWQFLVVIPVVVFPLAVMARVAWGLLRAF